MSLQVDRRVRQMYAFADTGVGWGDEAMSGRVQSMVHLLPRPPCRPRAVADQKTRCDDVSLCRWIEFNLRYH